MHINIKIKFLGFFSQFFPWPGKIDFFGKIFIWTAHKEALNEQQGTYKLRVVITTNVATYVALALPLPLIIKLVNFYYVQKNAKDTKK